MNGTVVAAIIAASVSVLTLIGTLAAQYFGRRATSRDTKEALDRTLAEQREQLDKMLGEHRTRQMWLHPSLLSSPRILSTHRGIALTD